MSASDSRQRKQRGSVHGPHVGQIRALEGPRDSPHVVNVGKILQVRVPRREVLLREALGAVRVEQTEVEVGRRGAETEAGGTERLDAERVRVGAVRVTPLEALLVEPALELVDEVLSRRNCSLRRSLKLWVRMSACMAKLVALRPSTNLVELNDLPGEVGIRSSRLFHLVQQDRVLFGRGHLPLLPLLPALLDVWRTSLLFRRRI